MIRILSTLSLALILGVSISYAQAPAAPAKTVAPAPAKAAPVAVPAPASVKAVVAAAPTTAAGFHGTWTLNKDKIKEMPEYKAAPEAQKKMMLTMLQQVNMEVTLSADSMTMAMEMGGQKKEESAKYVVKSTSGNTTVITTTKDGQSEEITLTVAGDELTMAKGEKQKLFLNRKK